MGRVLLLLALGQTGYESMDAGERFLYRNLHKKLGDVEQKISEAINRQNEIDSRSRETAVRVEGLKEKLKEDLARHRKEIDELNRLNSYRVTEIGGTAGGTGVVTFLAIYLANRRLARKGGRNGNRR